MPEHLVAPGLAAHGFRHAFFTRRGGHSPPPFDSLSFGSAGNDATTLELNVRDAAAALGVAPDRLYFATQVHGRDVVRLRGTPDRARVVAERADALLTTEKGTACAVKVADCVPVLVADRSSGAVAAIHSGWQGTEIDVVGAAIAALRTEIEKEADLVAAIGPHIEVCCFEVGEDVAARLSACSPVSDVVDRSRGERPHVDLRRIVRAQLVRAGVRDDAVEDVRGCTACDAALFFSHRRDRERSGRQLAAIAAR